jgi:cyclic-di-GMP-binding protein
MSALFQRLVAGLPERHAPGRNSFATDPKSLRSWTSHLPLANPGATARLLIGALREMNQLRLDPLQRLDALESLRPPIDQIIVTLNKQILADSFPLPPQKKQLGQLAQEFENELALGYCAVV